MGKCAKKNRESIGILIIYLFIFRITHTNRHSTCVVMMNFYLLFSILIFTMPCNHPVITTYYRHCLTVQGKVLCKFLMNINIHCIKNNFYWKIV